MSVFPSPRPPEPLGEIPGSFVALYRADGARGRVQLSLAELAERYDYCEDLAQMLVDTARQAHLDAGLPPSDVLERIERGLADGAAGASPAEAQWTLRRLAELMRWDALS